MVLGNLPTRGESRYLDFIGNFVTRSSYPEAKIVKQSMAELKRRVMLRNEALERGTQDGRMISSKIGFHQPPPRLIRLQPSWLARLCQAYLSRFFYSLLGGLTSCSMRRRSCSVAPFTTLINLNSPPGRDCFLGARAIIIVLNSEGLGICG
jgi:hypothetical protein